MSEHTCKQCGEYYVLRQECDPTDYCDLCAQTMLEDCIKERDRLLVAYKAYRHCVLEINEWLESAQKEWLESIDIVSPKHWCEDAIRDAEAALKEDA